MVKKILGEQQANDIYFSAMLTRMLNEKQAADLAEGLEKNAAIDWSKILGGLKSLGGIAVGGLKGIGDVLVKAPDAAAKLALLGTGTGVLGATAFDILKENVSGDDPNAELNTKIEAMYNNRKKELEDAKWMSKVRRIRDELKRDYKKMTSEEYELKYNELMEALNERMA
jgi:hypothetical protein